MARDGVSLPISRLRLIAATLALSAPFAVLPAPGETAMATAPPAADTRPNVLLITTDDQTLADLSVMPWTRRLLAAHGTTFEGISPHPLCCPARAEILTGQFAQNNGVLSNTGPHGGYPAFDTSSTLATWLHDAGYGTAFLGKFLNGYSARTMDDPTPGWDEWHPTVGGVYNYTDFTIDHNGVARHYASAYQTDVYTKLSASLISTMAAKPAPFFMWQSFVAPHKSCRANNELRCWSPPVPAQRHAREFSHAMPPSFSDPAFNEADVSDKPSFVRRLARIHSFRRAHIVTDHRMRLRALQAVDEGVHRLFAKLDQSGELDNTLIIFTSDNGFLLGEHRLSGKNQPYEQALEVPFLMRGPGVPAGAVLNNVGATVDIASTIVAAAGVMPDLTTDGHNLLDVAAGEEPGWRSLLIQAGAQPAFEDREDWFFRGVRTARYTYVFYPLTGEQELYDRRHDPSELTSVVKEHRYRDVRIALRQRLDILMGCAGDRCRTRFGPLPRPTR